MVQHAALIHSDVALVDPVCKDVALLLEKEGQSQQAFAVDLVLREFINNAILHGNRHDISKMVRIVVRVGRTWIVIRVTDEGAGFDWRARMLAKPDETDTSGRGLAIGAQYSHRMRYNREGNQVTIWIRKTMKGSNAMAEFEISRDGAQSRITLGEKLTAAQVLQAGLKKEMDEGVTSIVFNLAGTVTLDSSGIGLLIAASNSLATVLGSINLTDVSPNILRLLQSMRLVDRLHATSASAEPARGQ
jgi:anti-sigma regulatory factor (Ser/Thr protein kinase)/ABC-type transporter Mla MlaB component